MGSPRSLSCGAYSHWIHDLKKMKENETKDRKEESLYDRLVRHKRGNRERERK
jgi:hypothetical protein